jgi:hypothetical protein
MTTRNGEKMPPTKSIVGAIATSRRIASKKKKEGTARRKKKGNSRTKISSSTSSVERKGIFNPINKEQ